LYDELSSADVSVLYDDRDLRAGEKLADSDLIGIPVRIIVGKDTLTSGLVEVVDRKTGEVKKLARTDLIAQLAGS
ncbi:MAG: His/Gly/Thr/Pro-type tRNA ligase C-terminal domain-containing protein, partial [Patescibacteria group bacterium]